MAEIEHFVDPEDKSHVRFAEVQDVVLSLLPRQTQESGSSQTTQIRVGDAVRQGVIANETLGYFVARISQFLVKIGIDPEMLRFRQHMGNEMAHYATDCWDAEIKGRGDAGWTECVGCADRAAYDLSVHSQRTGQALVVRQALKEPIVTEKEVAEWNKKSVGKTFKQDAGTLQKLVEAMDEPELLKLKGELAQGSVFLSLPFDISLIYFLHLFSTAVVTTSDGKQFQLTPELLTIERKTFKQSGTTPFSLYHLSSDPSFSPLVREYTPNVIEPSFGLGRILYFLLEHSFWSREQDVERGVCPSPSSEGMVPHNLFSTGPVPPIISRTNKSAHCSPECTRRVRAYRARSLCVFSHLFVSPFLP
jgi:glycyl-tRNA synthetase